MLHPDKQWKQDCAIQDSGAHRPGDVKSIV